MHKALSPKDVINLVKEKSIKFIDFRFMDYPGLQQHFTVPQPSCRKKPLRKVWVLTVPVFAGGSPLMKATCWFC